MDRNRMLPFSNRPRHDLRIYISLINSYWHHGEKKRNYTTVWKSHHEAFSLPKTSNKKHLNLIKPVILSTGWQETWRSAWRSKQYKGLQSSECRPWDAIGEMIQPLQQKIKEKSKGKEGRGLTDQEKLNTSVNCSILASCRIWFNQAEK